MKFQVKIGNQDVDVSLNDICDALDTAVSVIIKERHNNRHIKKNEFIGVRYDTYAEILKEVKAMLLLGAKMMRDRIPSKKRRKL